MMSRLLISVLITLAVLIGSATAQTVLGEDIADETDKGFLTVLLEDSLGGEGRKINITGFQGALSRQATMSQITIADIEGVWLTLQGITMEWNRSALLRGRLEIDQLSVDAILLDRLPIEDDNSLPAPEASGFTLPDLPVTIIINDLSAARIRLGPPILGDAAEMMLQASAQLAGGSASVDLEARRIDGRDGQFAIDARYDAGQETVQLSLNLIEGSDGIVARLLDIRDRPDLRLTIEGEGPIASLTTQVRLETGGSERLTGEVSLRDNSAATRSFTVDLNGDLAPLFSDTYQPFFGDAVALQAAGTRAATGALDLSRLDLTSGASSVSGSLSLGPDNWPVQAALTGVLESPDGSPLPLPMTGSLALQRAGFDLRYDAADSEDWTVGLKIDALDGQTFAADAISLTGLGQLSRDKALSGRLEADATGLEFEDPNLQAAIGRSANASLVLDYPGEGLLSLRDIELAGSDYRLSGGVDVSGLEAEFQSAIDVNLAAEDLRRFGPLLGLDLEGRAAVDIIGIADLGGRFDLAVTGTADDLGVGIERLDPFMVGQTNISVQAIRDTQGTRLPALAVRNAQVSLTGSANLATDSSVANFEFTVPDSTLIDPMLDGVLTAKGQARETTQGWQILADATGPDQISASVMGRVTGDAPSVQFSAQIPELSPIVSALSGPAKLAGTASRLGENWRIDAGFEGPYRSIGKVNGDVAGPDALNITFSARIPDVARLAPAYQGALQVDGTLKTSDDALQLDTQLRGPYGLTGRIAGPFSGATPRLNYTLRLPNIASLGVPINGPLALDGTAVQAASTWQINTALTGPGGTNAKISGSVAGRNAVNMNATGSAPLALANPFLSPRNLQGQARFDLRLVGPMSTSAVSGTVETTGARLSAPTLAFALQDISANIQLQNGAAVLSLIGAVSTGGQVRADGRIGLDGGMPANIAVQLNAVRLVDPNLYETSVTGALSLTGPIIRGALLSGQLELAETQVQIPTSRAVGFTIIPEIVHLNASPAVRQTLSRAGLNRSESDAAGSSGAPISLDLTVRAPRQIFVRGRGLDAELGGSLRLSGTTENIISSGQFDLIRGRLDVLGKRFTLDQGRISLQGRLEPSIRFIATTTTATGTASIVIEGQASEPEVTFTSTPAAPQDEVLAQIFFGRSLTQLSPFQALQLASAVATLAGGGETTLLTNLRRGFNLDDLDITSDSDGRTSLRLGKYVTENVYTDVQISNDNTQELSINIDATENLVLRGTLHSDGNTSVGVFFERDY